MDCRADSPSEAPNVEREHPMTRLLHLHHFLRPQPPFLTLIAILLLQLPSPAAFAQANAWTWMGGNSTFAGTFNGETGSPGVYGTLGEIAKTNIPGGRLGAVSWTDAQGNFWLFGGGGFDSAPTFGFLNDLWRFDPSTNEWTWMSGSSTIPGFNGGPPGIYGALGTPSARNVPGGRSGAMTWTDSNGDLWLFGGAGFDSKGIMGNLNDLWKYSPSTAEWTWVGGANVLGSSGSIAGRYGTLGSLTSGSYPGSRNNAVTWVDNSGNLWMFGGYGEDSMDQAGWLNDLWKFVPAASQWAWMGGNSALPTGGGAGWPGVYGTVGKPDAANHPGGRETAVGWVDKSGNLWLFGGNGIVGSLNDLWEFNPATNQWAWISGSDTLPAGGQPGVYGSLGAFAAANTPGSRASSTSWVDQEGNFLLFGGIGCDSTSAVGFLNDTWKFDLSRLEWAWLGGSNTVGKTGGQPGVYGTLGTEAAGNVPGGRDSAVGWVDPERNFWMMGGNGLDASGAVGYLNDLWKLQIVASTPVLAPSSGTYTSIQNVKITDPTPNSTIYYTTDGTTPTSASTLYIGPISVGSTETIQAVAIATNYYPSAIASATFTINLPPAAPPAFSVPAGTYTSAQSITISDTTTAATIYYTLDGTTPTTSSTTYTGPIMVSSTATLEAIAVASGFSASTVNSAAYVLPVTFTFAGSPASLTLSGGGQGTVTLTLTPQNGFNAAVTFACSGLPAGASCSFNPTSVTPTQSTSAMLTIAVPARTAALPNGLSSKWPISALALGLSLVGLMRRRRRPAWLLLMTACAGLGLVTACGGGSSTPTPTPTPTTSTVTVTASSGSIQQAATVSVTVN
jgi:N-acetylneuraminic acid mutarotase